jgi:stage II sporulation protein GA (sporulation sigma-E factor processing peptidase)
MLINYLSLDRRIVYLAHGGGDMKPVVYIDVLIFQNFFMNYLLLYITNRFCKCRAKGYRIALAAFVGALYVLIYFYPQLHVLYSMLMKFLVSALIIVIAFSPYKIIQFLKITIIFYITGFFIGGCIIAIMYLNNYNIEFINSVMVADSTIRYYIIVGSIVATVLVKLGFDYFENFYSMDKSQITIEIFLNKKSCSLNALIDTANSLRDPMTNAPVIVAYFKSIIDILPDDIKSEIEHNENYDATIKNIINSSLRTRIRMIPFKALGVENGMLTGIRADLAVARQKTKSRIVRQPVIALYESPVSNNDVYQALAYPEILRGNIDE